MEKRTKDKYGEWRREGMVPETTNRGRDRLRERQRKVIMVKQENEFKERDGKDRKREREKEDNLLERETREKMRKKHRDERGPAESWVKREEADVEESKKKEEKKRKDFKVKKEKKEEEESKKRTETKTEREAGSDRAICSLCQGRCRLPVMLPCLHLLCLQCLQYLTGRSSCSTAPVCPQCRQETGIPGGRITSMTARHAQQDNRTTCVHTSRKRTMYLCEDCEVVACFACLEEDHHGQHRLTRARHARADADANLDARQQRLARRCEELDAAVCQTRARDRDLRSAREAVEEKLQERRERLLSWVEEEYASQRQALDSACQRRGAPLTDTLLTLQQSLDDARTQHNELTHLLAHGGLLDKRRELGRQMDAQPLPSTQPSDHPTLHYCDVDILAHIRKVMGHVDVNMEGFKGTIREDHTFKLPLDASEILAISVGAAATGVAFSRDNSGTRPSQSVAFFNKQPLPYYNQFHLIREEYVKGEMTAFFRLDEDLGGFYDKGFFVAGKGFQPRHFKSSGSFPFRELVLSARSYGVYSKRDPRFVLVVSLAGGCELRQVTVQTKPSLTMEERTLGTISACNPRAMDANQDGTHFAVLESGRQHVLLYRRGEHDSYATYRGEEGTPFEPRDVCFVKLNGGLERLVVADWLNGSLHVLDVSRDGSMMVGHLGGDCPLLQKPTALFPGFSGELWIGCRGQHILRLDDPSMKSPWR